MGVYSCLWEPTSDLPSVTCHIESHSVTCYQTQVNATHRSPRRMQCLVDLDGWLCAEMVYLSVDSHPS